MNWNEIEDPILLNDEFRVIGHANIKEGDTLGENGCYVLRREDDGKHFVIQVTAAGNTSVAA